MRRVMDMHEIRTKRLLLRPFRERQSKLKQAACVCMLAAMLFLLTGCRTGGVFDGSRVSDASGFRMEYSILNREESAGLNLTEGDRLQVSLSHTEGTVDVTVGMNGKEKGNYHISVSGHQAKGNIAFIRIPGGQE